MAAIVPIFFAGSEHTVITCPLFSSTMTTFQSYRLFSPSLLQLGSHNLNQLN